MKKAIRLFISGTVQGIFFRKFVKDNADKNDVRGFVRNLEDGRIEIFLEGDHEKVENMVAVCKRGPAHSNLRKIEEKEEKFQDFKEFRILGI
ncbi:MAG TPA: acylphosphatase [Candidatus Nanoarchaeia archaeon]|nr:acylphosphatase [Candidatus Nanoarchaeia archaeon]